MQPSQESWDPMAGEHESLSDADSEDRHHPFGGRWKGSKISAKYIKNYTSIDPTLGRYQPFPQFVKSIQDIQISFFFINYIGIQRKNQNINANILKQK